MTTSYYCKWSWYERLGMNILKQGPMPNHVGIILDGNRRYAREKKLASVADGHRHGSNKFDHTLKMFLDLGIGEITVYAFSVENFKRPKEEVEAIMKLVSEKILEFFDDIDTVNEMGICVEVVGDWSRIPDNLRGPFARLMMLTRGNTRLKVNLAFVYTARNEITTGVNDLVMGLCGKEIKLDDLNEDMFEEVLRLHSSKPLDMLIRTSGECRLSDFLLWQASDCMIHFVDVSWPEFSNWEMLKAILKYQWHKHVDLDSSTLRQTVTREEGHPEIRKRRKIMIRSMRRRKWEIIAEM